MSWLTSKWPSASSPHVGVSAPTIDSLVSVHYGFVWRVLRGLGFSRADADDAAQQVFMIVARKLDRIVSGNERSFVYGTTLRVAKNAQRSVRRRREVADDERDDLVEPSELGPEQRAEIARARALLAELIAQLPEKFQRVLILAELEQLEVPEIARLEGLPVGTAASRLRFARAQFRELVSQARSRNPFAEEP